MSVPGSELCRQEKSYRLYLVFGVSKNKVRKPERRRGVSFGVQDDESQQGPGRWGRGSDPKVKAAKIKHDVCRLCRGDDSLSVCSRFRAMSPGEKLSFVWGKSFASTVLMVDMFASKCRVGVVCGVEGCTEKYSKLLHQSFMRPAKENFGEQQATPNPGASNHLIESHNHACSSPRQGQTKLALPIVPVKARAGG